MQGLVSSIATLRIPIIGRVLRNVRPITPPPDPMIPRGDYSDDYGSDYHPQGYVRP